MTTATRVRIEPVADRVFIKRDDGEDVTPGGIVLPDKAVEKPQQGIVIAVGPGKRHRDGHRLGVDIHVGARVLFSPYADTIEVNEEEFIVLGEDEIYAVLN